MTIDAQRHSDEMAAQRAQELAGDEAHYRLRKACVARAVEMYEALRFLRYGNGKVIWLDDMDKLIKEIESANE